MRRKKKQTIVLKISQVYIKKENLSSMKMVRGMVIALPQNEKVKIGPLVNELLYITHFPCDQTCPLSIHVHSLSWPLLELLASFITLASRSM